MEITFADRKGGFPHSEMSGSKGARASPDLIAACHVFHRLSVPRHPSEALMRLIVLSKTHAWGRYMRTSGTKRRARAHTCALILMSSQGLPSSPGGPGKPFNSRCHAILARPGRKLVFLDRGDVRFLSDGGARRVRTDDLMLAKHALYQLSYGPSSLETPSSQELIVRPVRPR